MTLTSYPDVKCATCPTYLPKPVSSPDSVLSLPHSSAAGDQLLPQSAVPSINGTSLLITTVIINSNYDEATVLYKCWMPALSLTIVLMISITCSIRRRFPTPQQTCRRHCADGEDRGGYEQDRKKMSRTGGVIVMKWKPSRVFRMGNTH